MADNSDVPDIVQEAHNWRFRLNGSATSRSDLAAFEDWLSADPRHQQAYDRAETVWDALGEVKSEDFASKLHRVSFAERLNLAGQISLRFIADARLPIAIASLAAAAIAVAFVSSNLIDRAGPTQTAREIATAAYKTGLGETRSFALEDGSEITLGAASQVETAFSETERRATLIEGVAYFDIAENPEQPFSVDADEMTVHVTGTQFDIKKRDDLVRVAVAEGRVNVRYPLVIDGEVYSMSQGDDLVAGQQVSASIAGGMSSVSEVDASTVGVWRDDRLVYDGDPLSELVADANRYSALPVKIEEAVDEVSSLRVRGAFSGREIDEMLSILPLVHALEIDRSDPSEIVIREARG